MINRFSRVGARGVVALDAVCILLYKRNMVDSPDGTLYRSIRNTATLLFESTRKTGYQSLSSCPAINVSVPARWLERNRVGTCIIDHRIGSSRGHLPAKSHHDNNRCRRRFDKRQVYFVFRSTCGCCRKKEERGAITGTVWK